MGSKVKSILVSGVVVVVACIALIAGCAEQPAASGEGAARDAFLAERAGTVTPGLAEAGDGTRLLGKIEKVDGRELAVKNELDSSTTIVRLSESAKVKKQASASLSELKPGETVLAFGSREGNTLKAERIQIGANPGDQEAGGPMMIERPTDGAAGPSGPAAGGSAGGGQVGLAPGTGERAMEIVSGTVESVGDGTVTLSTAGGSSVTVQLGEKTKLLKQVEVSQSELRAGTLISASGRRGEQAFEAEEVEILDELNGMVEVQP